MSRGPGRPALFSGPTKNVSVSFPWALYEQLAAQVEDPRWAVTGLPASASGFLRGAICLLLDMLDGATASRVLEYLAMARSEYLDKGRLQGSEGQPLRLKAHLGFRYGLEAIAVEEGWRPLPEGEAPLDDARPWRRLS